MFYVIHHESGAKHNTNNICHSIHHNCSERGYFGTCSYYNKFIINIFKHHGIVCWDLTFKHGVSHIFKVLIDCKMAKINFNFKLLCDCTILLVPESEVGVHGKSSNSVKVGPEVKEVKQTESRQRMMCKGKHRQDFIKKNIEVGMLT